jgi:hypothetical protein
MFFMKSLVQISLYDNFSALFCMKKGGHIEHVHNIVAFMLIFLIISGGIQW